MGCWSVYCSISKIAIRAGQECVFIPLKKNKKYGYSYLNYLPVTLPIFGKYDDYGGLENIVDDENTKFIEDHFKVTISQFVEFFTDGIHSPNRGEETLVENEEIKSWRDDEVLFMFIDRKVWDFMSTNTFKEDRGCFSYKDKEILSIFGVENQTSKKGEEFIWGFKNFTKAYDVDKSKHFLKDKTDLELYEYYSEKTLLKMFSFLIGANYQSSEFKDLEKRLKKVLGEPFVEEEDELISEKYCTNIQKFAKQFSELAILRTNLRPMSGDFEPYVPYLTPQCGEIRYHQILLKEFSKINKSYCGQ